jgi:hypothetical protein
MRMQITKEKLEGFAAYLTRLTAEIAQIQQTLSKGRGTDIEA